MNDTAVVVHFSRDYLHQSEGRPGIDPGTGWSQEVLLVFAEASLSGSFPDWPCDVMDGELVIGDARHRNSIPLPLEFSGPTELRLVCDCVNTLTVTGRGISVELVGTPRYVDEFSP